MLFTFYDTETSGLEANCDILSFSYILGDEFLRVKRAETLYFWKEGLTKWSQEAYEVHGLSKEFLREHEKDYEKNLKKMWIAMNYAYLVGFNSGYVGKDDVIRGFDFPRCREFLRRNGLPTVRPNEMRDVMHMAGRKVKLQTLFDELGLSRALVDAYSRAYFGGDTKAHNSAYDTICTMACFSKMYKAEQVGADIMANVQDVHESGYVFTTVGSAVKIKDKATGEEYTFKEFNEKYPLMFKQMIANPKAYR